MSDDQSVKVRLAANFQFVGSDSKGHSFVLDADKPSGEGTGVRPMDALLIALGACTGMDIVQGFKKFGKKLDALEVSVGGERNEVLPKYFKKINIHFEINSPDAEEGLVEKLIKESDELFCSVGATLKGRAQISTSFRLNR